MPLPQISQFSPPLAFLCASGEFERSACAGEPFYKEYEGRGYCVLHYPGTNKTADFEKALRKKLGAREFNFEGVRFPEKVSFCKYHFTETVSFRAAVFMDEADFTDANFNKANFTAAVFMNGAVFSGTTFNNTARFNRAVFEADAHFRKAHFEGKATFINTEFKANFDFQHSEFSRRADFYHATFHGNAGFRDVTFKDDARFARDKETQLLAKFLDLQHTRIEKPERILFHTLALLPQWFVNVNTRKFEFINVEWYEDVDQKPKKKLRATSADPLLAICYRNLAVNAEENHRYDEASTFRYLVMDTRRHLARASRRREKLRVFPFLTLEWWYWVASGYGERILRALSGLIAVWLLFTVFYWNTPFVQRNGVARSDQEKVIQSSEQVLPLDLGDACIYSLGVMTLQKQETRPVYKTTRLLVLIETVLGPLQAALLALAIRRKFIR